MSTGWAWVGTRSFTACPPNLLWSWLNVLAFAIVCRAWSPLRGRGSRCSRDRLSARLFGLPRLGRGGAAGCSASRGRGRLAPCARPRSGEVAWGGRAAGGGASVGATPPASAARVGRVGRASARFRSAVVLSTVMTTGRRGAYCRARSSAAAIAAWCADCCVWCRGAVSGARPAWVEREGAAPRADSSGVSVPPAPTRCAVSAHPAAGCAFPVPFCS